MADDSLISKQAASRAAKPPAGGTAAASQRAVVFADITGSNALYQLLGDIRALTLITRCLVVLEEQVYEHRGQVIKTVGEQIFCIFPDANTAAVGAIAMQQRMEHFAAEASVALSLKIGVRCGALIEEQDDIFGDAVNVAARLVKLAGSGQIMTDAPTLGAMRATLRRRARALDRRRVKGKSSEIQIVEIGWRRRSGEDPFTTEQAAVLERSAAARIMLRVDGHDIGVESGRASFTIGRDETSDLPINSRKASRQHARIEWRRDKFVLFDHSTNGTYVTLTGQPEVMVKHESFLLRGSGVISIGEAAKPRGRGIIEFECR